MNRSQLKGRGRRPKRRETATRTYRKLFIIIVEGETEKAYFDSGIFKNTEVSIVTRTAKKNHPAGLVEEMERKLDELRSKDLLRSGDPAWLVLDYDDRSDGELSPVFEWAAKREKQQDRGIAYSKPQFEFWLILHHSDGTGVSTQAECMRKAGEVLEGYRKGDSSKLPLDEGLIADAITRARSRLAQPLTSIEDLRAHPSAFTSVHFLAEQLLNNSK